MYCWIDIECDLSNIDLRQQLSRMMQRETRVSLSFYRQTDTRDRIEQLNIYKCEDIHQNVF